jgi:hypothetical protein
MVGIRFELTDNQLKTALKLSAFYPLCGVRQTYQWHTQVFQESEAEPMPSYVHAVLR